MDQKPIKFFNKNLIKICLNNFSGSEYSKLRTFKNSIIIELRLTKYLRILGNFEFKKSVVTITDSHLIDKNKKYPITWINNLCFYHPQGNNWWYYMWNGKLYHCIKYIRGTGYEGLLPYVN
jgi:hypothetical protein